MNATAKILYALNSLTCIFIGSLHIMVHYDDLVTSEVQTLLNHSIPVGETMASMWDLWQGMSLMMGAFLILVGMIHLLIIQQLDKTEYPPVGGSLLIILMLIFIIYIGFHFFGSMQIYGGIIGIVLQTVCLVLTIKKRELV